MPIQSLRDLSDLNSRELYNVYLAIARADHQWRVRTMHGDALPPVGHSEFRPLSIEQFDARMVAARNIDGGETMLRQRLSRQAAAYEVNVDYEVSRIRQAA